MKSARNIAQLAEWNRLCKPAGLLEVQGKRRRQPREVIEKFTALKARDRAETIPERAWCKRVDARHLGASDHAANRHFHIEPDSRTDCDVHGATAQLDGLCSIKNFFRVPLFKRDQDVLRSAHVGVLQGECFGFDQE
ncbi:hypothetical protein FQZ97_1057490 [compost metagenome]